MSLIAKVTTRAGCAASARRPPLMADRCLRIAFISTIFAPLANRLLLAVCLSAKVILPAGRTISEDPPPDIKATTRSSAVNPFTAARIRHPASSLNASGVGCDASSTSMRPAAARCPCRVTTTPLRSTSPQAASSAAAIATEALPAPTTTQRPFGFSGKCRSRAAPGSALTTAASKRLRSSARVLELVQPVLDGPSDIGVLYGLHYSVGPVSFAVAVPPLGEADPSARLMRAVEKVTGAGRWQGRGLATAPLPEISRATDGDDRYSDLLSVHISSFRSRGSLSSPAP